MSKAITMGIRVVASLQVGVVISMGRVDTICVVGTRILCIHNILGNMLISSIHDRACIIGMHEGSIGITSRCLGIHGRGIRRLAIGIS